MSENKVYRWQEGLLEPEKVMILDLSNENLTELKLDILVFDALEKLILDHNPGIKVLPEELEYLPGIRAVSMIGCDAILLSQLHVFQNLESLDISEMHFQTEDSLNGICQVKTIKEIIMNRCTHPYMKDLYNLKLRLPKELGNLSYLEKLSVENCFLETLPDSLSYLENLQYLSVKNNFMNKLPKGLLELPALREFYAAGNSLENEKTRIQKIIKVRPDFITDFDAKMIQEQTESSRKINRTQLSSEVIAELNRLGVPAEEFEPEEKYFTPLDLQEEVLISPALVQLLWGFDWKSKKLMWKEPPFSCQESWNDEAYEMEDEAQAANEKIVDISYMYFLDDSIAVGEQVYLCIGSFTSEKVPYRLTICLDDENMENPAVYTDDYVLEPSEYDSLSGLLNRLTNEENWDNEYTAMNQALGFRDDTRNDFMEIKVVGCKHFIKSGKMGTPGEIQEAEFDSPTTALEEAKKILVDKLNEGYEV